MKKIMIVCLAALFAMTGCAGQSKTAKGAAGGAVAGAAVGAAIGQVFGGDTESTLTGAGIGAAIGGIAGTAIGQMMDNQEKELKEAIEAAEAAKTVPVAVDQEVVKTEVVRDKTGNEDLLAIILNGDVTFDTGSARIKREMVPEITRIAEVMVKYPNTSIAVEGHTDSKGSEDTNMALSKKRADAVRDMLIQRGVEKTRIHVLAFGEAKPVADNNTEEGRRQNRRVEIKIRPVTS